MSLAQSINEFNLFWEKHGDRQEEVLDALGEEWTDTAETFIGYDGQEGEFHLSDKVINHTNEKSDIFKGQINNLDFINWPLECVVTFFKCVRPNL